MVDLEKEEIFEQKKTENEVKAVKMNHIIFYGTHVFYMSLPDLEVEQKLQDKRLQENYFSMYVITHHYYSSSQKRPYQLRHILKLCTKICVRLERIKIL